MGEAYEIFAEIEKTIANVNDEQPYKLIGYLAFNLQLLYENPKISFDCRNEIRRILKQWESMLKSKAPKTDERWKTLAADAEKCYNGAPANHGRLYEAHGLPVRWPLES
ncbi:hypothetical protein BG011_008592 [Mortierella polycephala]|uniref:Uncharacterized protein n=1 Tax=Mortierella polycephala TaxID=41804 RepID=A0A9P6PMR1_9FUNG|nr:hypothetical protein BG011_008592 [Mortierella polycephala]